jgi:hypothetical protein
MEKKKKKRKEKPKIPKYERARKKEQNKTGPECPYKITYFKSSYPTKPTTT